MATRYGWYPAVRLDVRWLEIGNLARLQHSPAARPGQDASPAPRPQPARCPPRSPHTPPPALLYHLQLSIHQQPAQVRMRLQPRGFSQRGVHLGAHTLHHQLCCITCSSAFTSSPPRSGCVSSPEASASEVSTSEPTHSTTSSAVSPAAQHSPAARPGQDASPAPRPQPARCPPRSPHTPPPALLYHLQLSIHQQPAQVRMRLQPRGLSQRGVHLGAHTLHHQLCCITCSSAFTSSPPRSGCVSSPEASASEVSISEPTHSTTSSAVSPAAQHSPAARPGQDASPAPRPQPARCPPRSPHTPPPALLYHLQLSIHQQPAQVRMRLQPRGLSQRGVHLGAHTLHHQLCCITCSSAFTSSPPRSGCVSSPEASASEVSTSEPTHSTTSSAVSPAAQHSPAARPGQDASPAPRPQPARCPPRSPHTPPPALLYHLQLSIHQQPAQVRMRLQPRGLSQRGVHLGAHTLHHQLCCITCSSAFTSSPPRSGCVSSPEASASEVSISEPTHSTTRSAVSSEPLLNCIFTRVLSANDADTTSSAI
ncbi:hypothetical protein O0L34_g9411 [Tuta absoluta]|nr:hypothetical protein O0L34_g9411 [Tuta absoluta]